MRVVPLLALGALLVAGCARQEALDQKEVVVLAAASLAGAFNALGRSFEEHYPDTVILVSYAGSQTLATQVREGAVADVIATADPALLDELARAGRVDEPRALATNRLVWLLAPTLPEAAAGASDRPLDGEFLRREGVRLVLAVPEVPAGRYSLEVLERLGVAELARSRLVSSEIDVRGVLGKLRSGDADAGLVYATDALPNLRGPAVRRELPAGASVVARYAIARVKGSPQPERAADFIAFVQEPSGQATLRAVGFGAP